MKQIIAILVSLCLGACAYRNPMSDMNFQTTTAPPYVVANWYKIEQVGTPIKIYLEGDGHAFDDDGQPTDNPAPKGTFMRELAAGDPSPNVAYVARPCQFLQAGCSQSDWTTGRFSENIIRSTDTVIASLMKKARTDKAVLIGFSGGAQVAGLVAVRHPERFLKVITIAGVLDHQAWTAYHGDPPLTKSLNLKDKQAAFKKIPQIHYAGDKDDVVPADLIRDFAGADRVVLVKGAGHGTGFKSVYRDIYEVQK